MAYPKAIYRTGEEVLVGDRVQFRSWLELWLQKHEGRVLFVPGVSPPNDSLEYNGLKWVAVRYLGETETAVVVHPETGVVRGLTFVGRSDDGLTETPEGYEFPDD